MKVIQISETQPEGEKLLRQKCLSSAHSVAGIFADSADTSIDGSVLS